MIDFCQVTKRLRSRGEQVVPLHVFLECGAAVPIAQDRVRSVTCVVVDVCLHLPRRGAAGTDAST